MFEFRGVIAKKFLIPGLTQGQRELSHENLDFGGIRATQKLRLK